MKLAIYSAIVRTSVFGSGQEADGTPQPTEVAAFGSGGSLVSSFLGSKQGEAFFTQDLAEVFESGADYPAIIASRWEYPPGGIMFS